MRCGWLVAGWLIAFSVNAHAAGIDCIKARSATEKAICASPSLLALDRSIADAYADKLSRQPDQARQDLIAWLKQRDATCNVPSAAITQCLAKELTTRLAALAPPPSPVAQAPPVPVREPAVPSAANPPPPAAVLDAASLPAMGQQTTLLHVTSPGRFTITAHSPTGAALQLVDMLAGPSGVAGNAGSQDGRLDPMLDVGTYKLKVFSAKAATGAVALTVTAFANAAAPRALPTPGAPFDANLQDGQQRAFWFAVPPSGAVRIEAAGRSLADLRLWRDGRDLADLAPDINQVEPAPGHPLTDARLVGKVEPGTYLAVAYGGPAARWTDNDASQPFHLRAGASDALADGWAFGAIGPFGSEVFTLPASAQRVRLELPTPAAVTLSAGDASVTLDRTSREASSTLAIPSEKPETIALTGVAGQPYKLQALAIPQARTVTKPGSYWVSAVTSGTGGDEAPPSVLLERTEPGGKPPRIVGSVLPVLSPNTAWRGQFNLRGPTTMLFQNTAGGPVSVRSSGVETRNGRPGGREYDLPADYYAVTVSPTGNAQGVVDLVVGAPGQTPAPTPPLPPNPVLPLGVQTLAPGQSLFLSGVQAPGIAIGLSARPIPVALAEGPLSVTLAAGSTQTIPISVAPGGALAVTEGGGGPVPFTMQGESAVLSSPDRPRTIVLSWKRAIAPPADIPAPPALASVTGLQAGRPVFLDLAANQQRGFSLTVPQGGLYRVETLGRLHTSGKLATPFIPALGEGDANGIGQNMLIQSVLRAGRYRVDVTALDSAGHLGVSASPAPLLTGATLRPGGSVRATMPVGSGASFPITVAGEAERYHLEVAGLGGAWTGRVEDADGWPITNPGPLNDIELALQPGQYRMLVIPDAVTRQVAARLTPIVKPAEIMGHGPHPLAFETPAHAVWREPDGRDQPRTPDAWTFSLAGPAEISIALGDGMAGDLHRDGTEPAIARITRRYSATLEAGQYRLDTASLGRNDRLDYTVALTSKALQPGIARQVTLPATLPFAIAEPRVVSVTSFGTTPVKAVLHGEDGSTIARIGPRTDDWNIALSRPLPAGRYTLDLAQAAPPDTTATSSASANNDDSDAPDDDGQAAQTTATQTAEPPRDTDAAADSSDSKPDDAPAPSVEIRLALPAMLDPIPVPTTAALPGPGVHVLTLPQPAPGSLIVVQALAFAEIALTLERQEADGWRIVALGQGSALAVASPADADAKPWRVQAWTVDGGPEPIGVVAWVVDAAAQAPGHVSLAALNDRLAVARVHFAGLGIAAVAGVTPGMMAGGWPGHALTPVEGATVLPGGSDFWLLGHGAALDVTPEVLPPGATGRAGDPGGAGDDLARQRRQSRSRCALAGGEWVGPPGLGRRHGRGGGQHARAGGRPLDPAQRRQRRRPARPPDPHRGRAVAATHARRALADGARPRHGRSPSSCRRATSKSGSTWRPGLAAVAGGNVVWTGGAAVSRSLVGPWRDILLVNTGDAPAPASLSWQPASPAGTLHAGSIVKRFFGADGSFEVAAEMANGAHLIAAGNATLTVITADGHVARGRDVALTGPARAVVDTTAGAMAVWESADGVSPWPTAAAQPTQLPARLTMSGPAMALALQQDVPLLLHARTTAPVLVGSTQSGRASTPELFPAGAEWHRMVAAGHAELRLYSPHDGPLSGHAGNVRRPHHADHGRPGRRRQHRTGRHRRVRLPVGKSGQQSASASRPCRTACR